MKKKLFIIIIAIVITTTGLYTYLVKFDPDKWENAAPWHRRIMVNDLIEDYDIIGMSKADIIELLGDSEASFGDDDLYYYLGSGLIMSEVYLHVIIEENIVLDVEVFTHSL